jgi:hypothetical protein
VILQESSARGARGSDHLLSRNVPETIADVAKQVADTQVGVNLVLDIDTPLRPAPLATPPAAIHAPPPVATTK